VEPVLPLSIVFSVMGGTISSIMILGKKFEAIDAKHLKHLESVDARMDAIELRLAKEYVDKEDIAYIFQRIDDRIDRIDNKLDQIIVSYNKCAHTK